MKQITSRIQFNIVAFFLSDLVRDFILRKKIISIVTFSFSVYYIIKYYDIKYITYFGYIKLNYAEKCSTHITNYYIIVDRIILRLFIFY